MPDFAKLPAFQDGTAPGPGRSYVSLPQAQVMDTRSGPGAPQAQILDLVACRHR